MHIRHGDRMRRQKFEGERKTSAVTVGVMVAAAPNSRLRIGDLTALTGILEVGRELVELSPQAGVIVRSDRLSGALRWMAICRVTGSY